MKTAHCSLPESYSAVITIPFLPDGPKLGIRSDPYAIFGIDFLPAGTAEIPPVDPLAELAMMQLRQYFSHPGFEFSLPLETGGTPFQRRVWRAMRAIPYGQTRSYGELADQLKTGARAIGNACRRNPVTIIIPCHRVVGSQGLGGYSGATSGSGLDMKRVLLNHEQQP